MTIDDLKKHFEDLAVQFVYDNDKAIDEHGTLTSWVCVHKEKKIYRARITIGRDRESELLLKAREEGDEI